MGTLITGATGFLGGEVLVRLLERGDGPVHALVRAPGQAAAQERLDRTVRSLLGGPDPPRHRRARRRVRAGPGHRPSGPSPADRGR